MLLNSLLEAGHRNLGKKAIRRFGVGGETENLTFSALIHRTEVVSRFLMGHVSPGDAVLLVFESAFDFLPAFLACLQSQVLAVPVQAPLRAQDSLQIFRLGEHCGARMGIGSAGPIGKLEAELKTPRVANASYNNIAWHTVDSILDRLTTTEPLSDRKSAALEACDRIAYIQYSSGSTKHPRGIKITSRALLHNLGAITEALALSSEDVCVTWLPYFHDMGLVGTLLAPLFVGASTVILTPLEFVRAPITWLRAFSDCKGTFTASPNFGYEHCVRHVNRGTPEGLDLSSWRAAANGAEPVQAKTINRFTEAFKPFRFNPSAWAPCYGLAEATLIVSMSRPTAPISTLQVDRDALQAGRLVRTDEGSSIGLVSCGPPVSGTEIVIVDPISRHRAPPDGLGEIWVRSASVAGGYLGDPTSSGVFDARIVDVEDSFLRTGDLGILHKGELFIAGRIKDIVIIRGRNIFLQDIEHMVREANYEHRAARVVAFARSGGEEEGLVILQESRSASLEADYEKVIANIRAEINRVHGVDPEEIAIVRKNSVILTSSGKLARWRNKLAWERHETSILACWRREGGIF